MHDSWIQIHWFINWDVFQKCCTCEYGSILYNYIIVNLFGLGFRLISQLDDCKDFEERKMIRTAMRELRKKKRGDYLFYCTALISCSPLLSFFSLYWWVSVNIQSDSVHSSRQSVFFTSLLFSPVSLSLLSEAKLGCSQEEMGRVSGLCVLLPCWPLANAQGLSEGSVRASLAIDLVCICRYGTEFLFTEVPRVILSLY